MHNEIRCADVGPGTVPPGTVERPVEAAWPGARTHSIPGRRIERPEALPVWTVRLADDPRPTGPPAARSPQRGA